MVDKKKFFIVVQLDDAGQPKFTEFCNLIFDEHEWENLTESDKDGLTGSQSYVVVEHELTRDEVEALHEEIDQCDCGGISSAWDWW